MASTPDTNLSRSGGVGISRAMRGWNSPRPVSIRLQSDGPSALRRDVRRNLTALIPRCEQLDHSLPSEMLRHAGFVASKLHRRFPLEVGPELVGMGSGIPRVSGPS